MAREHAVIFEQDLFEQDLRIPTDAFTLEGFQDWADSEDFPETGRIDFVAGDVEVEMSPEDLYTHAVVKTAISARLSNLIVDEDRGEVYIDRTRVVSRKAGLSVEPDVVVVLWESFETGRVRYAESSVEGRSSAIHGAPDVIVEIVSSGSVRKDTVALPARYAQAGVPELWLADARGAELRFSIQTLRDGQYVAVEPGAEGWIRSPRLGGSFRLLRHPARLGHFRYMLEHRP
ncbi:MAG TPA: Uma2 family endonuclease [Thermoanaerobaculia bacterium]|jgi:Uma2 family endonuclease|nr:Uma2 family endonuclease [Thermoanaerobaculia bacterium]